MLERKWAFSLLVLAILSLAIGYSYSNNMPVWARFREPAAVDPNDSLFVIFNPFRDREPEIIAASFLSSLKDDKCEEIRSKFPAIQLTADQCEQENTIQIIKWELINRKDQAGEIELHYKVSRIGYPKNVYGNTWIKERGKRWEMANCWI
ncbi:MAG: hypothetical protein IPJ07_13265 [Acidobacteria bacterium]|nr:hypothetical protein [Acidobacteriota bacterium]